MKQSHTPLPQEVIMPHIGCTTAIRLLAAGLSIGMLACTSEDTPTEPSLSPSLARVTAGAYVAVDLGTLGGHASEATAVNPAGQVAGFSETTDGAVHAFLLTRGVMVDLGTLEGRLSFARGINPAGQVVGNSSTNDPRTDGCCHAFLWDKGVMTFLGTLGGGGSEAAAINPAGQIVGHSDTPSQLPHAYIWEKGVMTDLGTLPGGTFSRATAINPAGVVVGFGDVPGGQLHAFLWRNGAMSDLGPGSARGINPAGQVVGGSTLWDRRGVPTDLGTIEALGINPKGEVAGFHFVPAVQNFRPAIWSDGVITDLPTLGGIIGNAFAINPAGEVVGRSQTAAGEMRATLWTRR
jgi:probable HAF family extracellular repeat protein